MKRFWLISTLLICWLLLTGCNNTEETITQNTDTTYTWKYLALYPFWVEIQNEPDYSWMTVAKLYNDLSIKRDKTTHCGKDYYFLNSIYYKTERDEEWNYKSTEKIVIQEGPTTEPLYFDWEMYQNIRNGEHISLDHLEWNILISWYLEKYSESECFTCNEEEAKDFWTVEVWKIRPDDENEYGWLILWYTEWEHLVAIYPNIRFDDIECFNSYNKCTDYHECVNLNDVANDWKIHTFRIVLDDWWSQERAYFGSMIREWDFIN